LFGVRAPPLLASTFFAVVLFLLAAAGFFVVDGGFEFSFAADGLPVLGASLTFPDGPLGNINIPDSVPDAIARPSWNMLAGFISTPYLSSANFLIVVLETPTLASSLLSAMHSLMISFHGGLDAADFEGFLEETALALVPFVVAAVLETDFLVVVVAADVLFLVVALVVVLVAFLALVLGMSSIDEDESAESAETGLEADIV